MRTSEYFIATLKEDPKDAQVISHRLMLRAGMIRPLASGLYTWTPLGLKVLRKVEAVVREEMNKAGALECLMPVSQPAELWEESGRWQAYGPELLRFQDRHGRDFCMGPTHEEVITDLVRREVKSYKQLPVNLYQIQTKFRDEVRPRFGVMRSREFIMKDAYSFHMTGESLDETYQKMFTAYSHIFSRLGLNFRPVQADTGSIGGDASHEFHVLADSGEDDIVFSTESDYAANIELAPALPPTVHRQTPDKTLAEIATPNAKTIEEVTAFLQVPSTQVVKTLLVKSEEGGLVALLLRGDHTLNEIKAEKLPDVASPLTFASEAECLAVTGALPGSIGPVGLSIPVYADYSVKPMSDFVCGANVDGFHLTGVNWGRDVAEPIYADLRNLVEGDASPCGKGTIQIRRGIEVGHIFKLGTKYSEALNCSVLNETGSAQTLIMGCYGIGVTRLVAAAIEQNYDDWGIVWPESMSPFHIALVPMNLHKSERVREAAERLYAQLKAAGYDVLLDDRKERPGVMFADMELMGITHRVVVSDKGLDAGTYEYKHRACKDKHDVSQEGLMAFLQSHIKR